MACIANATTDPDEHGEIEVTSEMIAVGFAVLEDGLGVLPYASIVEEVYIAMARLAACRSGDNTRSDQDQET